MLKYILCSFLTHAYRGEYQEDTETTEDTESSQSDMDESPAVVEQTSSDTESAEGRKPSATDMQVKMLKWYAKKVTNEQ